MKTTYHEWIIAQYEGETQHLPGMWTGSFLVTHLSTDPFWKMAMLSARHTILQQSMESWPVIIGWRRLPFNVFLLVREHLSLRYNQHSPELCRYHRWLRAESARFVSWIKLTTTWQMAGQHTVIVQLLSIGLCRSSCESCLHIMGYFSC